MLTLARAQSRSLSVHVLSDDRIAVLSVKNLKEKLNEHHDIIMSIHAAASAEEKSRALDHAHYAGQFVTRLEEEYNEMRRHTQPRPLCWSKGAKEFVGVTYQTCWTYFRIFDNWEKLDANLKGEERSIRGANRYLGKRKIGPRKSRLMTIELDERRFVGHLEMVGIPDAANWAGRILTALNRTQDDMELPYRHAFLQDMDRMLSVGGEKTLADLCREQMGR